MLQHGLVRAWETPELTSLNKLPAHASFVSQPVPARRDSAEPWTLSLDGTWEFRYESSPEAAVASLSRAEAPWGTIPVPSNWQMHGHHFPHYTNVRMPFPQQPPHTPAVNPTGIYRRRISIPESWAGLRIVAHFGSADSVLAVWVDGTAVGLSKDARLPAEFDITSLVRAGGDHELVALVVQYSDASFLEDQDMWRLGGLPRGVSLLATPPVHIADVKTTPHVDLKRHTAELEVLVKVGFPENRVLPGTVVSAQLLDPKGRPVLKKATQAEVTHKHFPTCYDLGFARLRIAVPKDRLHLWSAEHPHRYTVVVTLTPPAASGSVPSRTSVTTGFRRIEVRDRDLLINGRRVLIKGVNHHEHHPDHAKAVPYETLRQDVLLMKRFNFNAVRLSHYPHDPRFLDLCDELGLYVIDETNAEAHDFHNLLCNDSRYATPWLDRAMRMVIRDINHPSIIAWSLGNESGYGPSHDAAAAWIRHYDPSRPVHYEGAISRWQSSLSFMHGSLVTDLICPMYSSIDELTSWLDFADKHCPPPPAQTLLEFHDKHVGEPALKPHRPRPDTVPLHTPLHPLARPVILCEYSHAMGNSNGSLSDYFALFTSRKGIQGGFIWEWLDHGLRVKLPDGREHFAYGGDFGDKPNDANFVCDGMVSADRIPHPACHEHHRLAQPIAFSLAPGRSTAGTRVALRVRNDHDFSTLAQAGVRLRWRLLADGRVVSTGDLHSAKLDALAPGSSLDIPVVVGECPAGTRERHLGLEAFLAKPASWAPKGHVVASQQLTLASLKPAKVSRAKLPAATLRREGAALVLAAGEITVRFDEALGGLVSLRRGEREFFASGPRVELWRGATDNDGIRLRENQERKVLGRWQALGLDSGVQVRLKRLVAGKPAKDGSVGITLVHEATTGKRARWSDVLHTHIYTLHPDGRLVVANTFRIHKDYADLPRVGVRLDLVPGFEHLAYFGRGPFENYNDRKAAADLAVWENTVSGEYVDYVMPQEHGHHTDVRWLSLATAGEAPAAIRIDGLDTLEFNATHHSAEDLYAARHTSDLKPRPETLVYLDVAQRGLGTATCGPDALPRYLVPAGEHTLAYAIRL